MKSAARLEKDYYRPKNRKFNKKTDVRWRVVYQHPETLGVKKESYKSKEEALERLKELNNATSTELSQMDWDVSDALRYWEKNKLVKLRSHTNELYRTKVLKELLGKIKIRDLKEEHILRLKAHLQNGRGARAVNYYLITLRTALNYSKKKGLISNFPFISEHVDTSLETRRERVMTLDEFERLLEACSVVKGGKDRMHLRSFLIWLHETGCRKGELAKVEAKDIDLDRGVVRIWSGKVKRAVQRECGITPRLRQHILESGVLQRSGLIFGGQDYWRRSFVTACEIAGVTGLRIHDLRRTAITNMLEKGIPLHLVAKMVGHSANSVLTLDVYTRFRADFIQEMMSKMG